MSSDTENNEKTRSAVKAAEGFSDTVASVTDLFDSLKNTWSDSLGHLLPGLGDTARALRAIGNDLDGFDPLYKAVSSSGELLSTLTGKDVSLTSVESALKSATGKLEKYGINPQVIKDYSLWLNDLLGIDSLARDAGSFFRDLFTGIDFGSLVEWFRGVGDGIGGFFGNIGDAVKGIVKKISGLDLSPVMKNMQEILGLDLDGSMGGLLSKVKDSLGSLGDVLKPDFEKLTLTSLRDYAKGLGPGLKDTFKSSASNIKEYGKDSWKGFREDFDWKRSVGKVFDLSRQWFPRNQTGTDVTDGLSQLNGMAGSLIPGGLVSSGSGASFQSADGGFLMAAATAQGGYTGGASPAALSFPSPHITDSPTGNNMSLQKVCDTIEIHIASPDDKGYEQINEEITGVIRQIFDSYGG